MATKNMSVAPESVLHRENDLFTILFPVPFVDLTHQLLVE